MSEINTIKDSLSFRLADRLDAIAREAQAADDPEVTAWVLAKHNEHVRDATGVDPHWQHGPIEVHANGRLARSIQ